GIARSPGMGTSRKRLGHQTAAPAARDQPDLRPELNAHAGAVAGGPREPALGETVAISAAGGDDPRRRACREWVVAAPFGRRQRQTLLARRLLSPFEFSAAHLQSPL